MRRALWLLPLVCALDANAQLTLGNGEHILEISGMLSTYYNARFLKPGEVDHQKDRFALRDAQLQFEGRYGHQFAYELQFDVADFSAGNSATVTDPENVGLMDANVTWKGLPNLDVTIGYGKLPYGRSSNVPFHMTPYWQRAEIVRGNMFSQRDVGLTLSSSFWKQRATVEGGVYTGLGELSLVGDNDASGHLEYIGRVELAWPSRYRKRDIDDRVTPVPMMVVGVNARYTDKSQPLGESLPPNVGGPDGVKVIDGKRTVAGFDLAAQYKGFSGQFEGHLLRMEPRAANNPLFEGTSAVDNEGYVLAGGFYGQLNWFCKPWRTIVSARYEELDLSDLSDGREQRCGGAVAYQMRGFDAMIKAQFWHIITEDVIMDPLKWTDQVRVGFQYTFN